MFVQWKSFVQEHRNVVFIGLAACAVLFAYAIGRRGGERAREEMPAVLTQEQTQDENALKRQLAISEANAEALERVLVKAQEGKSAPAATYYIAAPNVQSAADHTAKQIREDDPTLPRAAREKSDRTVVTTITKDEDGGELPEERRKVDVYKINLNKARKIKAGVTQIDDRTYWTAGAQIGRWEALAHGQGQKVKGGTVLYTVVEW